MYQRNVKLLIFGKDNITTPTISKIDDVTAANATTGTLFVVDEGNNLLTAAATKANKFKVCYKSGNGTMVFSDLIDPKSIVSYKGKVSTAATEQVTYIGYNGTSGSITVANDTEYNVTIDKLDCKEAEWSQWKQLYGQYLSDASATQIEIALGVASNLAANLNKMPEITIKAEVVCNDAGAANTITAGADATHYTFTKGSKYVVGTDSAGTAMCGSDEVVATTVAGDFLRAGTATTSPIYKIITVTDGTGTTPAGTPMTIELDRPYQGTTTSIAIGSTEYITAALAASANFGIKISSLAKKWALLKYAFEKQRFTVLLKNFGATALTTTANAYEGSGNYQQVAELEAFCQGNEVGTPQRSQSFGPIAIDYRTDYTFQNYYSLVSIVYKDEMTTDLGQEADSLKELIIALGAGSDSVGTVTTTSKANKDTNAGITVLDAIIATSAGVGSALTSVV